MLKQTPPWQTDIDSDVFQNLDFFTLFHFIPFYRFFVVVVFHFSFFLVDWTWMFSLGFEKIKESKMGAQKPNAVIATSFDIILFCGPQRKQF